jgi:hypothetical protein
MPDSPDGERVQYDLTAIGVKQRSRCGLYTSGYLMMKKFIPNLHFGPN